MIVILDFGSQYTQLIARRIREMGVYCEIHPCYLEVEKIKALNPQGVILSGGPNSVLADDAPKMDPNDFNLDCPILGVCYGQQLIVHLLGGQVENSTHREYGKADLKIGQSCQLLEDISEDEFIVWMSHGDRVVSIPENFQVYATSPNSPYAVIADESRSIYGIQFHPEVSHTQNGKQIISNFLFKICKLKSDWSISSFLETKKKEIREKVGDKKVLCGLSGGVDSSVVAVLLHEAIGDQLTCIFVDHGFLRKGEAEKVESMFKEHYKINLKAVDAKTLFYGKLEGIDDPEKKRKLIGNLFIEVFEEEAKKLGQVDFLAQGTLYPDVIESVSFTGGPSVTIKSHHNVGGLPEKMNMDLIEPLRELFKDEVRELGKELGLPEEFVHRHPFPGPGLAIRILGPFSEEKVKTLQDADAIILEEIKKAGLYRKVWQTFGVLLPVKSVGVMGDARTYEWTLAIRCVDSIDAMTADWSRLPYDVIATISNRIINEVPRINRVVYDVTSKPPGTIEWE